VPTGLARVARLAWGPPPPLRRKTASWAVDLRRQSPRPQRNQSALAMIRACFWKVSRPKIARILSLSKAVHRNLTGQAKQMSFRLGPSGRCLLEPGMGGWRHNSRPFTTASLEYLTGIRGQILRSSESAETLMTIRMPQPLPWTQKSPSTGLSAELGESKRLDAEGLSSNAGGVRIIPRPPRSGAATFGEPVANCSTGRWPPARLISTLIPESRDPGP
jgi:hypothetical protein